MQNLDYEDIWQQTCAQIKSYKEVDEKQLIAFSSRLHLQAFSMGFAMLTADNEFIKSWTERFYLDLITRALKDTYGTDFDVLIEVDEAGAARYEAQRASAEAAAATAAPTAAVVSAAPAKPTAAVVSPAIPPVAEPSTAAEASAANLPETAAEQAQRLESESVKETSAANVTANVTVPAAEASPIPSAATANPALEAMKRAAAASRALNQMEESAPTATPAIPSPTKPVNAPAPAIESAPAPAAATQAPLSKAVSNLTFANYVIGNSNRMAYSMALAVAENPGMPHLNPLFIYGKSGVGKTHLLRAIQNHINETSNGFLKTVYVDSTDFINAYANASADHSQEKASFKNFKKTYEDADVLLIDDVQSFQGKTQTLEIIFQLFNSLTSAGKQVVMSADIAPKNIDIDERYTSRFNQGATFDIQAPETETKRAIVTSFINEYRESEDRFDLNIPDDVQEYIAENSSANIRELKSAVTKIIYQMIYTDKDTIDIDEVAQILRNHFSGGATKRLTIGDIQQAVESFYQISHDDLISKKRSRSIAHPRQVAMYLCRQLLENNAYQRIGDEFGKKDHTTVMHSVGLVETKVKENKEMREELDILIKRIRES